MSNSETFRPEVTRRELHNLFVRTNSKEQILEHVISKLKANEDVDCQKVIRNIILQNFFPVYQKFWKKCNRHCDRFQEKYITWLDETLQFPDFIYRNSRPSSRKYKSQSCKIEKQMLALFF